MDKIRLILTLVTIAITVGPIVGVLIMYQNNLVGLFIPPQVADLINSATNPQSNNQNGNTNDLIPESPQVTSTYDPTTRTFTITFPLNDPIGIDITVNSMTGDLVCGAHKFPLGKAALTKPVTLTTKEPATVTAAGTWTEEAISHFQTEHVGEKTITVDLTNIALDASGFKVQINESVQIPNIPIRG